MNERQLPRSEYLALKAAFRGLVTMAGGPNRAATITRGNASLLSRYGAPQEDMFAPADVVADLEAEVGEPVVTRVLAEMSGQHLVPKCKAGVSSDFLRHLGAIGKETGDVVSALSVAMADGGMSQDEAKACLTEARELARKNACLIQDLEAVVSGALVRLVPRSA